MGPNCEHASHSGIRTGEADRYPSMIPESPEAGHMELGGGIPALSHPQTRGKVFSGAVSQSTKGNLSLSIIINMGHREQ